MTGFVFFPSHSFGSVNNESVGVAQDLSALDIALSLQPLRRIAAPGTHIDRRTHGRSGQYTNRGLQKAIEHLRAA
jgi:hypothetical protein